ncbi:hypothetical protein ACFLSQ_00025 [Bacteroidota bacterium]
MRNIHKYFLVIFIIILFNNLYSEERKIIIEKAPGELPGTAKIINAGKQVTPIALPDNDVEVQSIKPVYFMPNDGTNKKSGLLDENEVIYSDSTNEILSSSEYLTLELDLSNSKINFLKPVVNLSEVSEQALELAPNWLYDQLKIKLTALRKSNLDDDYAQLIIDASDNIKDEVAFCVANMSYQTLTDSRFISDKEMIIRNAEFIYNVDDSLQYVDLVEHGSIANKDYYTTTKYRIYDPVEKDTIWSEIPREHYYWYIVHPKMDQEGVYVKDNNNDNSGQRTYNYSWRDFIWNNPDPSHDYTPVNITTSKGSVISIPRFGELIQSPRILWNRTETYLAFGREFLPGNSALDVIGNWCSRALPVDVQLPRAFQPNQIIMKHNGMCNEDAFLTAGTCRTALIPIIYLTSSAEDHVYGAIWDEDWHHFEFFRGGLQVPGNDFYGITNMLPGGSYGWQTSISRGFRPDGYILNFAKYYADTCHFDLTVVDSKGVPIEGTMVKIHGPYGNGYQICYYAYTDCKGKTGFAAGGGKQYLVSLYHPSYGYSPADKTQAYYLVQGAAQNGVNYTVNVPYPNLTLDNNDPENLTLPANSEYGFRINFATTEIISGISEHDHSQNSRFYKWNDINSGVISLFVCDIDNYNKFKNNQPYIAYDYTAYTNGGELTRTLPAGDKFYVVFHNNTSANILEKVDVSCELLKGNIQSIDNNKIENTIAILPNPFNEHCLLELPVSVNRIDVYDAFGRKVDELKYPFIWNPGKKLSNGTYFFRAYDGEKTITAKGLLYR